MRQHGQSMKRKPTLWRRSVQQFRAAALLPARPHPALPCPTWKRLVSMLCSVALVPRYAPLSTSTEPPGWGTTVSSSCWSTCVGEASGGGLVVVDQQGKLWHAGGAPAQMHARSTPRKCREPAKQSTLNSPSTPALPTLSTPTHLQHVS